MKKIVITLAACLVGSICFTANAQVLFGSISNPKSTNSTNDVRESIIKSGDNLVTGAVGLPLAKGYTPFLNGTYERVILDLGYGLYLGAGGRFSYVGYHNSIAEGYDYNLNIAEIAGLCHVHFVLNSFDFYSGFSAGYIINNVFDFNMIHYTLGGRYFFKSNMAAGIEIGGLGGLNVSFTFKF